MFKCNMFPTLDTYMKALTHEEQVKPMRGTDIKPIHLRSRKDMQIMRLDNDDIVYIDVWGRAREPEKDWIVKWKPNGEIHVNAPMYNCVYEQLTSLLGIQFCREKNHLWVECSDHDWDYVRLPLHSKYAKEVSVFKWVKTNNYPQLQLRYVNPPTLTQKAIDRGVAKAVRKKYQRVYDYLKGMVKLRDDSVYRITEFMEAFGLKLTAQEERNWGAYWAVQRMLPKIALDNPLKQQDDIVEMVSLANEGDLDMSRKLWLACVYANGCRYSWQSEDIHCAPNQVVKAFDNFILRVHREEVFYDKEVPTGRTPSTANDKFFR